MKVSVLGCGDPGKILRFSKTGEDELKLIISGVGRLVAGKGHELVIIPDRGVPAEVAKVYRESGGKKVIGVVPVNDSRFGIEHLKPYLHLVHDI